MSLSYQQAGVDIAAADNILSGIANELRRCRTQEVLQGVGGFASLFDLTAAREQYNKPVLAQSIDGVGSKTLIAAMAGEYRGLGADLFAAVCNDVAVTGAKVLTFLDYIAQDRLDASAVAAICSSLVDCCQNDGVALVGGETAEMPGIYQCRHGVELVGVASGLVERDQIITGSAIQEGQRLFGFSSSGLHTNGYSLIRRLFFEQLKVDLDYSYPELGRPLAEVLLEPHQNYLTLISQLLQTATVTGLAHITGGGIIGNLPRIMPPQLAAVLCRWPLPPLFQLIARLGSIAELEMFKTFNMGIGLVAVGLPEQENLYRAAAAQQGLACFPLGEIVSLADNNGVRLRWQ